MGQELKLLSKFENDKEWFYKHINELRERNLTGKFVAIQNNKVISSNKELEIVIKNVEKEGMDPAWICIEFVYPEGYVVLL
jgi:hypothetical protein